MILVTGITGHSGKYFLRELIDNKYEGPIRCVVRESSESSLIDSSELNIEKIIGDLSDQQFLDKIMIGVDTVVHISSIFYSVAVMKAAVNNGVRRAILVHTTGIYSKYKSASEEYKQIEASIEKIIEESNSSIGLIYLRPTMIYGNINDRNMIVFIKMVDRLRLFPVIDHGKSLLQPVYGKDLGRAYYQVLRNLEIMKGDYILSGEKPLSMIEMLRMISNAVGKKTRFISVPLGLGVFMAKVLNIGSFGKVDFVEKTQRMGEDRSFPHTDATRDFGYNPMPFEIGLKAEIEQYMESHLG